MRMLHERLQILLVHAVEDRTSTATGLDVENQLDLLVECVGSMHDPGSLGDGFAVERRIGLELRDHGIAVVRAPLAIADFGHLGKDAGFLLRIGDPGDEILAFAFQCTVGDQLPQTGAGGSVGVLIVRDLQSLRARPHPGSLIHEPRA